MIALFYFLASVLSDKDCRQKVFIPSGETISFEFSHKKSCTLIFETDESNEILLNVGKIEIQESKDCIKANLRLSNSKNLCGKVKDEGLFIFEKPELVLDVSFESQIPTIELTFTALQNHDRIKARKFSDLTKVAFENRLRTHL